MAVVATGFFDGVHLGHRLVIEALVREAHQRSDKSLIVTFWPHPRMILQQDARTLRLLSSREEKMEQLRKAGVDRVETIPFSRAFAAHTGAQYLQTLRDCFGATAIVVGYDTRIGCDLLGPDGIEQAAAALGLPTVRVGALDPEHGLSSTKIRAALEGGRVEDAGKMLGYRYSLRGVVVSGNQLGCSLGYPTANMQLSDPLKVIPGRGVYLTEVEVGGEWHYGMTNIGVRPTLTAGAEVTIETHILDFSEDIYGLEMNIGFIARIRDERRFPSVPELVSQLAADERRCNEIITEL